MGGGVLSHSVLAAVPTACHGDRAYEDDVLEAPEKTRGSGNIMPRLAGSLSQKAGQTKPHKNSRPDFVSCRYQGLG